MQVVTLASRKGGSGKTTLAGHLAVEAERCGDGPVALVDLDPQGSLADWWNLRAADTPRFVQTSVMRLGHDLAALQEAGIKLLVIDTPPALNDATREVVRLSDLVYFVGIVAIGLIWWPLEFHFIDGFAWAAPGAVAVRAAVIMLPLLPLLAALGKGPSRAVAALSGILVVGGGVASCLLQAVAT